MANNLKNAGPTYSADLYDRLYLYISTEIVFVHRFRERCSFHYLYVCMNSSVVLVAVLQCCSTVGLHAMDIRSRNTQGRSLFCPISLNGCTFNQRYVLAQIIYILGFLIERQSQTSLNKLIWALYMHVFIMLRCR
jgi:hypothetical protein